MHKDPRILEEGAHQVLAEEKFEEAYKLFIKAADAYVATHHHKQAAVCFASAAGCWGIKSGEKAFFNSASAYERAAQEAVISGDYEYASVLFRHAAINYEKDMEFLNFSECFYRSKEAYRTFLARYLFLPNRVAGGEAGGHKKKARDFIRFFYSWSTLTISHLVWGHGERPFRTLAAAGGVISAAICGYRLGHLVRDGVVFQPTLFESAYVSIVTFTTVGYGDMTPIGFTRGVAMGEALAGLIVMPLLMIALSRKYLRV
jgi:hypothetical protein